MNKNAVVKTLVAGLVAVAMCGTTMAASAKGHAPAPAKQHQAPPRAPQKAPAHGHKAPAKDHGREVAHHAPAHRPAPARPAPPPPTPKHHHHHHDHDDHVGEAIGWGILGAAVVGIIGAIAG